MNTVKIKKYICSIVLFFFFFNISVSIPLLNWNTYAKTTDFYNIVSLIVDSTTYTQIQGELSRYSEDISHTLENTKVVIIPVPENANPFALASINEGLYFDGYKSLDNSVNFNSRLIGTVFIGNISLPEVYNAGNSEKTVLPYVDFENKSYIYNQENGKYEKNNSSYSELQPEIWHSFISPNTGSDTENIEKLKIFFNKNHDFYTGEGFYNQENGIINGDTNEALKQTYKPYVFYFDSFRENQILSPASYLGYKGYLENKEDLNYNRFTKELAKKLKQDILGTQNKDLYELAKKLADRKGETLDPSTIDNSQSSLDNAPDIQTRYVVNNAMKKFLEVFSKGGIGEMRKNVFNTGRYNFEKEVHVDFLPYFVSVLDLVNDEILKELSTDIEDKIDKDIAIYLGGDLEIPLSYKEESLEEINLYENFFFGKFSGDIAHAKECSIYRGSLENGGKLVEANRGYNIRLIDKDRALLEAKKDPRSCFGGLQSGTSLMGYWGKNSPLYLDFDANGKMRFKGPTSYDGAIEPIFDIEGSKQIDDSANIPHPNMCLRSNLILAQKEELVDIGSGDNSRSEMKVTYSLPKYGGVNWSCNTANSGGGVSMPRFAAIKDNLSPQKCEELKVTLNGAVVAEEKYNERCSGSGDDQTCECDASGWTIKTYAYRNIQSHIFHKSPSAKTIQAQLENKISPDLPVDKNRYVDFIDVKKKYVKINYPYLYRIKMDDTEEITLESVEAKLDEYLKNKTNEITASLSSGYSSFDIKDYLLSKGKKQVTVGGETKEISYYDILVFAIFWNNLNTPSAKYGYIFENYLANTDNTAHILPKKKNFYEIAYLGSKGTGEKMFIGLDPNTKNINPYADIISQNQKLASELFGSKITDGDNENTFECAPPDGVPLWEWPGAVMCWLKNMMPPTIEIGAGACGDSFLTNEEKETLAQCNIDKNADGINDCYGGLTGIKLSSESNKYPLNSTITLQADVNGENGNTARHINGLLVEYILTKLEAKKEGSNSFEVVYDRDNQQKNDENILKEYINFSGGTSIIQSGKSQYYFSSKDKEINAYFIVKSALKDSKGNTNPNLDSSLEPFKIEIRSEKLFVSSFAPSSSFSSNMVQASDATNIYITTTPRESFNGENINKKSLILYLTNIGKNNEKRKISYPLKVEILKGEESINIIEIANIEQVKGLTKIKESGNYNIKITDSHGFSVHKNIVVTSGVPAKIELNTGSNYLGNANNITTGFLTLQDSFGNVAAGDFYDIKLKLTGNSALFADNNKKVLSLSTYEGYKIFRIKSTESIGKTNLEVQVFNAAGKQILETSQEMKTLEDMEVVVENKELSVGDKNYTLEVQIQDKNGNILSDLNSRIYPRISGNYVQFTKPYFEIENGTATLEFSTKKLAGKDIPLELQIEGIASTKSSLLTINPELPMKIDLISSKGQLEANGKSFTEVQAYLKDRYGNTVFTDSQSVANIEIPGEYSHVIKNIESSVSFRKGIAIFKIKSTKNPGVGFYKIEVSPDISGNSFTVGSGDEQITISAVSANAGKVESFYFWNKERIEKKGYNSLYTTLLGSNYGDIEQKDYLAGSLLFEKNSKALAVTSVISASDSKNLIVDIHSHGGVRNLASISDISQNLDYEAGFSEGNLFTHIYNKSTQSELGTLHYNFPSDTKLQACGSECSHSHKATTIFGKSLSSEYDFTLTDTHLIFSDSFGTEKFSVDRKGLFSRSSHLKFEIDTTNAKNFLKINILSGRTVVGYLGLYFKNPTIKATRATQYAEITKNSIPNSIILEMKSSNYTYKNNKKGIKIFYNDPFASKNSLSSFSRSNIYSYENFPNKGGLGWSEGNKTLLSFAAGENVGESLKKSMSFSSINLGDPVISLKKLKRTFSGTDTEKQFDSTIGNIVSQDEDIEDYRIFDYNNDKLPDVLIIKHNKYLKLLQNTKTASRFTNMGNLAYIYDLGSPSLLQTGNFSGDGFEDIFFVSTDGKPYILGNIGKDFVRFSLQKSFGLSGKIIQSKAFDMDKDGATDIVTLDDSGAIHIFYGNKTPGKPHFTKKLISSDFSLRLDRGIRADNSLVYFDGLYQIGSLGSDTLSDIQQTLLDIKIQTAIKNGKDPNINANADKAIIESLIFEQLPYTQKETPKVTKENLDNLVDKNSLPQVTFIKGKYSESAGIKVEKRFSDLNKEGLKAGDVIEVNITLTNTSSKKLSNIAYLERIEKFISFNRYKGVKIVGINNIEAKSGIGNYNFLIDKFSLQPGQSITIKYEGIVKPINYGHIKVGTFKDKSGFKDQYGDIVVQDTEKNCSKEVDMFFSTAPRAYTKGTKEDFCKAREKSQNSDFIDTNNNGIPDYIDALMNPNNPKELKDYADKEISEMNKDSDNDGKPDGEDYLSLEDGKLTLTLGGIGKKIDDGLGELENLVNGLSCGFNNGSCISTPLNWAPLAPGGDPTFMGKPIGDGLKVGEGIPIFSAVTWMPTTFGCIPTVYPTSVLGPGCSGKGAGGSLGINSPTNFFRLFVTPTLTGGVGVAACFGSPASVAGYSNMPGLSPLFPGGNCVVVAKPILGCSNDGSDGNPEEIGTPIYNDDFGYINGNCDSANTQEKSVKTEFVSDFLKSEGTKLGVDELSEAVEDHSVYDGKPLINIGGAGNKEISIDIDTSSGDIDYSDVEEIHKTRIKAFPAFLMDWVTRQIEEIVTKLTDFPDVFIILPDFKGVYDTQLSWKENSERWYKNSKNINENKEKPINVSDELGEYKITKSFSNGIKKINSGIKEAYEFIGSFPLVKIEEEPIHINIPGASEQDIERQIASWKLSAEGWKAELERAKTNWTLNGFDDQTIANKITLDTEELISSIERNIEILEEYKNIPEKLNKLLNKKQEWLEQIICNIDSISELFGGWISENGKRFKAWVETYILIKAILKSWQALIDIFVDYEAECKECKNERSDLLDFQFSIINMIVPDIPVVQFPKWPDIIIDLHNIRLGVVVKLPTFDIDTTPIIFPEFPELVLPDTPNAAITFPKIPTLPTFEIPELPDLPSLPSINLPDLPPPPKLPKLFAGFEFVTDIAKLITKAMCILKMSPFVPEWRAGDQIAFLTERNGFLSFDFLNQSLPQFSFPFVDAIRVTTYVNLEYETDFIVELARQIASPINNSPSDFSNVFDINLQNADFSGATPDDMEIDLGDSTGFNMNNIKNTVSFILAKNLASLPNYIRKEGNIELTNEEFKKEVYKNLASTRLTNHPKFEEIHAIWKEVENYNFSKEDETIEELKKYNREKFKAIKDIINTEIVNTKKLKSDLQKYFSTNSIQVASTKTLNYNSHLKGFNDISFQRLESLVDDTSKNHMKDDIQNETTGLLNRIQTTFNKHKSQRKYIRKPLASLTPNISSSIPMATAAQASTSSCSAASGSGQHIYKGIYIFENNLHYRLFDYTNELVGDEEITVADVDGDGDNDLFYLANGTLYLKENLKTKSQKHFVNESPRIINLEEFLSEGIEKKLLNLIGELADFSESSYFLPAVNNVEESVVSSTILNVGFSGVSGIHNYRFSYYTLIDKQFGVHEKEKANSKKEHIIDGVSNIDEATLQKKENNFIQRRDTAYIKNIGNTAGIEIYTEEMKSIKQDIISGKQVFISNGKRLFAGNSDSTIEYTTDSTKITNSLTIPAHTNIEIKGNIRIQKVTGNLYIKTGNKKMFYGRSIQNKLKGTPIFPETKISFSGSPSNINGKSYIEIAYYDGSELNIDFSETSSYELFDLGPKGNKYLFSLDRENDYYYGKIYPFKDNIVGTGSKSVLSAPQIQADKNKPEISINSIRIPVYQNIKKDITSDIFEDSGLGNIKAEKIYMDFDLKKDSNGDGDPRNDNDSATMDEVSISVIDAKKIILEMNFTEIMKKKVGFIMIDGNANEGYKEIDFEVYAPKPDIHTFVDNTISGKINEDLKKEPINIYKYRNGKLGKLLDKNRKSKVYTVDKGAFNFQTSGVENSSVKKGLSIEVNNKKIANIDETTGYIKLLPIKNSPYEIKVDLGEDFIPNIKIQDKKNSQEIFYQKLRIKSIGSVKNIQDIGDIQEKGLYINILNRKDFNFYTLPENIKYNSGSLVIYKSNDSNKKPKVIIFNDGRIKLETGYRVSYSNYKNKYIVLNILDSKSKKIANVIYFVDGEYNLH